MSLADIQSLKAMKTAKQNANLKNGFDTYGFFVKPADFTPTLPCNVWRDASGNLYNDMNFSQYTNGATAIYVSASTGNDTTGDGSSNTPYRTILKAFNTAVAGAASSYNIIVKGTTLFFRGQCFPDNGGTITNKTISITPDVPSTRIRMTTHQNALSWTNVGSNTFQATRSSVCGVFYLNYKDSNGIPIPFTNVSSVSACQSTPYSWYTDNTSVWVNSPTGSNPDDTNWIISVNLTQNKINLMNNSILYMQNCDIIQARDSHAFLPSGDPSTSSGNLIANNCTFVGGTVRNVGSGDSAGGNAYAGTNLKNTYLFNCIAAYSYRDGFNHHFSGVANDTTRRNYFVMEFNCLSYNNGLLDMVDGNNNAFTCHEGVNILRFGCIGHDTTGPILADVMSCYSINVYCNMYNSVWQASNATVCYYFDQVTPPTGVTGKTILLNCTTIGDTKSSYQGSFNTGIPVYVYGSRLATFSGNSGLPINMI